MSLRKNIHQFLEEPSSVAAYLVQGILLISTVWVVSISVVDMVDPTLIESYPWVILTETPILFLFLIEYVLRFASAEERWKWFKRPLNLLDLLVVLLGIIHFTFGIFANTLSLRILRLARLFRVLSVVKIFKQYKFFAQIFVYKGTILEAITPVIVLMAFLKGLIWILESLGYWIESPNLGDLFAIIGFALGIILSQKIGVTYQKFVEVDETLVKLSSTLQSLRHIFSKYSDDSKQVCISTWTENFLKLIKSPSSSTSDLAVANKDLYENISALESNPGEMSMLYISISQDAHFCIAKKTRLTPKAYDTLLHQATLLYLVLITLFIPGITGLISILIASYILYGMYRLTQDLDSILGGDFQLINIDLSSLKYNA